MSLLRFMLCVADGHFERQEYQGLRARDVAFSLAEFYP